MHPSSSFSSSNASAKTSMSGRSGRVACLASITFKCRRRISAARAGCSSSLRLSLCDHVNCLSPSVFSYCLADSNSWGWCSLRPIHSAFRLKEAEVAARPRPPLVVLRHAEARIFEDAVDVALRDAVLP